MKKIIFFIITGVFLITPCAWANYTLKAKEDVDAILQRFYQEERVKGVTFSMQGLMMEINRAFNANIERPEVKPDANPVK